MKNHWSIDTTELEKNPEAFAIWDLEQRINWGIGEGKINKKDLLKYWDKIDIDVFKRKALSLALF
ncbi:MAG: hypothetical protein AAB970_01635 [Patescibacteria group bacterium]